MVLDSDCESFIEKEESIKQEEKVLTFEASGGEEATISKRCVQGTTVDGSEIQSVEGSTDVNSVTTFHIKLVKEQPVSQTSKKYTEMKERLRRQLKHRAEEKAKQEEKEERKRRKAERKLRKKLTSTGKLEHVERTETLESRESPVLKKIIKKVPKGSSVETCTTTPTSSSANQPVPSSKEPVSTKGHSSKLKENTNRKSTSSPKTPIREAKEPKSASRPQTPKQSANNQSRKGQKLTKNDSRESPVPDQQVKNTPVGKTDQSNKSVQSNQKNSTSNKVTPNHAEVNKTSSGTNHPKLGLVQNNKSIPKQESKPAVIDPSQSESSPRDGKLANSSGKKKAEATPQVKQNGSLPNQSPRQAQQSVKPTQEIAQVTKQPSSQTTKSKKKDVKAPTNGLIPAVNGDISNAQKIQLKATGPVNGPTVTVDKKIAEPVKSGKNKNKKKKKKSKSDEFVQGTTVDGSEIQSVEGSTDVNSVTTFHIKLVKEQPVSQTSKKYTEMKERLRRQLKHRAEEKAKQEEKEERKRRKAERKLRKKLTSTGKLEHVERTETLESRESPVLKKIIKKVPKGSSVETCTTTPTSSSANQPVPSSKEPVSTKGHSSKLKENTNRKSTSSPKTPIREAKEPKSASRPQTPKQSANNQSRKGQKLTKNDSRESPVPDQQVKNTPVGKTDQSNKSVQSNQKNSTSNKVTPNHAEVNKTSSGTNHPKLGLVQNNKSIPKQESKPAVIDPSQSESSPRDGKLANSSGKKKAEATPQVKQNGSLPNQSPRQAQQSVKPTQEIAQVTKQPSSQTTKSKKKDVKAPTNGLIPAVNGDISNAQKIQLKATGPVNGPTVTVDKKIAEPVKSGKNKNKKKKKKSKSDEFVQGTTVDGSEIQSVEGSTDVNSVTTFHIKLVKEQPVFHTRKKYIEMKERLRRRLKHRTPNHAEVNKTSSGTNHPKLGLVQNNKSIPKQESKPAVIDPSQSKSSPRDGKLANSSGKKKAEATPQVKQNGSLPNQSLRQAQQSVKPTQEIAQVTKQPSSQTTKSKKKDVKAPIIGLIPAVNGDISNAQKIQLKATGPVNGLTVTVDKKIAEPVKSGKNKIKKKKKKSKSDEFDKIFLPRSDKEYGKLDDVEKEIEDFKRFCLYSPQPPVREKIKVNINMTYIRTMKKLGLGFMGRRL